MRYVVWIAGISESSNLWTQVALSWFNPPGARSLECRFYPLTSPIYICLSISLSLSHALTRTREREREREREKCVWGNGLYHNNDNKLRVAWPQIVWDQMDRGRISLSLTATKLSYIYYTYIYICAARGQPCVGAARVWWWYESLSRSLSVRCVCVCGSCACTRYTRMHIVDWGRERETDRPWGNVQHARCTHLLSGKMHAYMHIYMIYIYTPKVTLCHQRSKKERPLSIIHTIIMYT